MNAAFPFVNESLLLAIIRELRPKQWLKNVFVLAPLPYVAGENDIAKVFVLFLLIIAFCAAASSVYVVNDLMDREKDRSHPTKRYRPIASGEISVPLAISITVGLTLLSTGAMTFLSAGAGGFIGVKALIYLLVYLGVSHFYTLRGKHIPYVDVLLVGSLYGIRVLAGFSAVKMQPAGWLLWALLALLLATFVELGKRYSELRTLGDKAKTRKVLESYSDKGVNAYFVVVSIAIVGVYPLAAWKVTPWFSASLMLVGPALYLFYAAIKNLSSDTHPMEVILTNKTLCGILILFSFSFLIAAIA